MALEAIRGDLTLSVLTYIVMRRGFLYLVAIMDSATPKVLTWRLSSTMDAGFCVAALEEALAVGGQRLYRTALALPEIRVRLSPCLRDRI